MQIPVLIFRLLIQVLRQHCFVFLLGDFVHVRSDLNFGLANQTVRPVAFINALIQQVGPVCRVLAVLAHRHSVLEETDFASASPCINLSPVTVEFAGAELTFDQFKDLELFRLVRNDFFTGADALQRSVDVLVLWDRVIGIRHNPREPVDCITDVNKQLGGFLRLEFVRRQFPVQSVLGPLIHCLELFEYHHVVDSVSQQEDVHLVVGGRRFTHLHESKVISAERGLRLILSNIGLKRIVLGATSLQTTDWAEDVSAVNAAVPGLAEDFGVVVVSVLLDVGHVVEHHDEFALCGS